MSQLFMEHGKSILVLRLRVVNKQFLGKRLGTYPAFATKMLGCSPQVQNTRGAVFYPIPKTLEILHLIPS